MATRRWREWVITADEAREHFAAALEAGINFFDTADVYSIGVSEEITGRWLGEMAARDEIVIATKVHGPMGPGPNRRGLSRKHILEACDASLRRLKTDLHRPLPDPSMGLYDADRRNARGARLAGARGQGALPRRQQHGGVAVSARRSYIAARARMASLRLDAEPLQPGLSRGRARDDSAVHRPGRRRDPVEPARARLPRRQSPLGRYGRDARAPKPTTLRATCIFAIRLRGRSRRRPRSRASAASRRRRSRAHGFCRHPASPLRSSARPSSITSRNCSPSVDIKLTKEEVAALEKPYEPHPVLGFEPPRPAKMLN